MRSTGIAAVFADALGCFALAACGVSTSEHGSRSNQGSSVREAGSASWDAGPCSVAAPTACPDPAPHYADVAPILQQRCVTCHSDEAGAPWPLTDYDHVAAWADAIQSDLLACLMPPWDAGIPISTDETAAILTWILCGAQK
jgi:uncharacterized membrane protein